MIRDGEKTDPHKNSLTNVYNADIIQKISYIIAMTKTDEQTASREPGRVKTRWRACSGSHPFRAEDSKGMQNAVEVEFSVDAASRQRA